MEKTQSITLIILTILLVVKTLTRLTKIKFSRSDKREYPSKLILENNINLSSCGPVFAHFGSAHFFTSSFKIESEDKIIYIDPIIVDKPEAADYIFISHAHPDHFSIKDINKLIKEETVIICPKKVAKKLAGYDVKIVEPGEAFDLDGIKCEAVAAYSLGFPTHPKSSGNVGYIITIGDQRIYHAGDTDFVPEIKSIENITVALVPIDGGNLTMSTDNAAEVINLIKPKIAIPMHYDLMKNTTEQFKQMVNKETTVIVLR